MPYCFLASKRHHCHRWLSPANVKGNRNDGSDALYTKPIRNVGIAPNAARDFSDCFLVFSEARTQTSTPNVQPRRTPSQPDRRGYVPLKAVSDLPAEYPGWMIAQQSMNRFPETPSDT